MPVDTPLQGASSLSVSTWTQSSPAARARTIELQSLAVYRKALSAYHFAVADILEWKGIKIDDLPDFAPPPAESLTPRPLPPTPPPA